MAVRRVQLRRGTSAQNDAFIGAVGEITVDTDRNSIRVHNEVKGGGVETARVDLDNINFDPNATVSFSDSAGNPTVRLTNVADPTGAQDVATKAYVDSGGASEILLEELGDTDLNDTNAYADAQMLLYDLDTGKWWNRTLSGDATIDDLGVITLTANSVITTDITDGNVTNAKLANSTVTITDGVTSDNLPLGQTLTFTSVANETTIAVTADAGGGLDGVEVTIGLPDDVTIGQDLTINQDLSVGRNAVITGNLTVNGTTTTINSTTVSTSDVVIELAQDADQAANASTDAGFVFTRGNTEAPAVLYFDEGDDSFYLGTGVGATGATTDFSTLNGGAGIDKGTLKLASLDATTSAIVTGDVTLKADNATFDIQTSAGASKFSVDSDNGNTLIAGTLGVTGISTFDDDLAVKANPTTSALVVNSDRTGNGDELDANVISVTRGVLNSATLTWEEGADDFIFSEKLHSVKAFSVGGAGSANATASITALGAISTTSTLSVDGATTLNTDATITTDASLLIQKATAETDALILLNSDAGVAPQDAYISVQRNGSVASVKWDEDLATWALTNKFSVATDASVGQDLSVTRNAGVTGTLTVTSTTALNDNVTLNGADLTINDGLGNDKFTVDNATGNTVIEGTLNVTGVTTFPVNSVIADFTFTNGNIASATGSVSFNALPISTGGDISCVGLSNGGADITNVGDIALDSISADGNTIALNMTANQASAFAISEVGGDTYLTFNTTADNITFGKVFSAVTGSTIGDLTLADGSITDSSGAISFGDENLSTTGTLSAGATTVTSLSVTEGNITNVGDIALDSISADDTDIAINLTGASETALTISEVGGDAGTFLTFDTANNNVEFGKVFVAVSGSTVGTLTLANGSITDSNGNISFGDENLSTTGTLSAGATTVTSLSVTEGNITNVGDIALDSISADATDIAINLTGASASALTISEVGADAGMFLTFDTTDNNVEFGKVFVAVSGSTIGTLTLADGSITDTSGTISFGDEAVKTTGSLSVRNAGDTQDALIITANGDDALITSFGGDISFGDENLSTSGAIAVRNAGNTQNALIITADNDNALITSHGGNIYFDNENLLTTGTLSAGASTLNSASVTTTLSVTGQSTLDDTLNIKTAPTNNVAILVNSDVADADVTIVKVNDTTANVQVDWDDSEDSLVVKGGKLHSETQVSVGGTITTAPNLTFATSGAITTLSTLSFETASTGAIVFNSDLGGGVAPANTDDFGITVNRGSETDALLYWDESEVRWQFETGNVAIQNSLVVDSDAGLNGGAITISAGSITSDSGLLDFGDETLNTTGSLTISTNLLVLDSTGGGDGLITANSGTISFDDEDLVTTGEISTATLVASSTSTLSGDVRLHSGADLLVYSDAGVTQKLSIDGATGNVSTQGTLTVAGVSTHSSEIVPNADGATSVGTNAVRWGHIYSDNVTITDDLTIDAGNLAVSTGTTTLAGLLNANGGIAVDGTKFTVADVTGNTIIEGTLEVNGATTLTSDVSVTNGDGGGQVFGVAFATGNTTIEGTLGVAKTTTINSADGSADLAIQNNTVQKFLVEGDTGNTDIEGTLKVAGSTEIETGSFTVTTGNAVITAGDLTVTAGAFEVTAGATTLQSVQATSLSQSGATLTLVSGGGAATDAFVSVERGATDAQIKWNETTDKWQVRDVSDGSFYNIVDTNTTLFSLNAGGNNKNFILSDGADTLTINGSGGITVQHAGNGTVALSLSDSLSVTSDLTVGGTATFNGATMRLVDTLLYLGLNNASTANNVGFYGQYKDGGGTSYYAGLVYQPLNSKFQLFSSETGLGSTEVSISPTDSELGALDLASLTASTALSVKSSSDDTSAKTAITLNSDQTGVPAATEDVSIVVERGDSTNASLSWDEGDDRWTLDQGTGTSSIITTTTASEGARYACNEPAFAVNALSISAPSAVISKNAYFLDNGATAGTVTLFENASGYDGYVIVIFNEGTNTLTIQGSNGETVGGGANQQVASGASLTLMARGTNWYVM